MEQFIRIAFWIFTLSGSLQAKSLGVIDNGVPNCKIDESVLQGAIVARSDLNIESMRNDVKCEQNATFYAPENVADKCLITALDCIIKELKGTAKPECDDQKNRICGAVETLTIMKQNRRDHGLPTSVDCACEKWRQTSFSEFLNKIDNFFEHYWTALP